MIILSILIFSNVPLEIIPWSVGVQQHAVVQGSGPSSPNFYTPSVHEVFSCTAKALTYVGCDKILHNLPSDGNYRATVVVFDGPLSIYDWLALEGEYPIGSNFPNVDIIMYPFKGSIIGG